MINKEQKNVYNQGAAEYDGQIHKYNSYSHDILFGMSFEYVNSGDCLLDLGIGTGLASRFFARLGLNVYGCDSSSEMLKICKSKAFAKELKVFDLHNLPLPYSDNFFNHAVCCGVLHFFDDLAPILKEVYRIIKPGGIFAFTIAAQTSTEESKSSSGSKDYLETMTPWRVLIFKHSSRYISDLLTELGVDILKTQQLIMPDGSEDGSGQMLFSTFISCYKIK